VCFVEPSAISACSEIDRQTHTETDGWTDIQGWVLMVGIDWVKGTASASAEGGEED
jgi:hypothetical protein